MLSSLLNKLRSARAWRKAHNQAWAGYGVPGADGLTPFQRQAVVALESELGDLQLVATGTKERYLRGNLPGTSAILFVYEDGAEIQGGPAELRAECWDFESPSSLVVQLVSSACEAVRSNNSFKPNPLRGSA